MIKKDWRIEHREIITEFLSYTNRETDDYILKGGTSLMMCYGLDRFSEDIDFDSINKRKIAKIIENFSDMKNFSYRVAKDTNTTQRYFINYGNDSHPLKVEISFRAKEIDKEKHTCIINGIRVYNIDMLFMMKLNAYMGRDKIRDLYDIVFISNNYQDTLDELNKSNLANALTYKGLEHFDYMVYTQIDELIDNDRLAEGFLKMYESAGLLYEERRGGDVIVDYESNKNTDVENIEELSESEWDLEP